MAQTPQRQRQYLDIAYRKACEMDVLLQRLFYFSKLETGSLPLALKPGDLGDFVRRFAGDLARELEPQEGKLDLRVFPAPHPVRLDEEQLYRVLRNLADNALRYSGAHPLILTITVWRQGDTERIRFADNGRGVAPESLPHLFEQFWREDQARSSKTARAAA